MVCAVSAFVCIECASARVKREENKTVGIWRERERTWRTSCVAAALRGVKHGAASVSVVRRRFLLLLLLLIFVCECGLACARGRRRQSV